MKILITELPMPHGAKWQVRMDQHVVSFRTEGQAKDFVITLQKRLEAPHTLPQARSA